MAPDAARLPDQAGAAAGQRRWVALGPGSPGQLAGTVVLAVTAGARLSPYLAQTVSETQFLRGMWCRGGGWLLVPAGAAPSAA